METASLQDRCELGQQALMRTDYWEAERILARAEVDAWAARDFDTLSRLYMPLQEARRQRRQRCGEGIIKLDLLAAGPADLLDAAQIADRLPAGQLLLAGWQSIGPALKLRQIAAGRSLYVESLLAAVYNTGDERFIAIVADEATPLPATAASAQSLQQQLGLFGFVLGLGDLPTGRRAGNTQTYAHVMSLWERLHVPLLAAADAQADPIARMQGYRRAIVADYACELAHQKLADVARSLSRSARR